MRESKVKSNTVVQMSFIAETLLILLFALLLPLLHKQTAKSKRRQAWSEKRIPLKLGWESVFFLLRKTRAAEARIGALFGIWHLELTTELGQNPYSCSCRGPLCCLICGRSDLF